MSFQIDPRSLLFGLMVKCPFDDAQEECPLHAYREGSLSDRRHVAFNVLSDSDVEEIIFYHNICCAMRDEDIVILCS